MAGLVLVVNADKTALEGIEALLSKEGHVVASATTFQRAKELLSSIRPDLLVADVRLGAFNGLHLAFWARSNYADLPVIITDSLYDSVLEQEAGRLGAIYVVDPLKAGGTFLPKAKAALESNGGAPLTPRRWARKLLSDVVEAHTGSARARLVDISYGGMRLAFDDRPAEVPTFFDLTLPTSGITLKARRVWMLPRREGEPYWCGAEIAEPGTPGGTQWRAFVDSVHPPGPLTSTGTYQ